MENKFRTSKLLLIALLLSINLNILAFKQFCNFPKECKLIQYTQRHLPADRKVIKCLLNDDRSQLRFKKSYDKDNKTCELLKKEEISEIHIRPRKEGSLQLKKGTIDLNGLIEYTKDFHMLDLHFQLFNGFELDLFDENSLYNMTFLDIIGDKLVEHIRINYMYCTFDFYVGNRQLKTCEDFNNLTNPRSIFQLSTKVNNVNLRLYSPKTSTRICPLVFKDFQVYILNINGENSYYSKRILSFLSQKFDDLNTTIVNLYINIDNVNLDFELLHPSVFKNVQNIRVKSKIDKIEPNLFVSIKSVEKIYLKLEYMRSLMHTNGIEWIKNMNRDVNCNLTNTSQLKEFMVSKRYKMIYHDRDNTAVSSSFPEIFPDEDFCLYKDFPINQLVFIIKEIADVKQFELDQSRIEKFGCTYIWITRHYKQIVEILSTKSQLYKVIMHLLDSDDYKSCKFDERLKLCNKTDFKRRHIITFIEIGEAIYTIEVVLNILSFILVIFGIVSNILIIIAISSKINETEFKGFKQYEYLRLNSICNCLILFIHLTTWLNECVYPYQVFCPIIRKAVFMQYIKIVVQDVLMTSLRFMNNFTYIGFAFNRISLIGKDHNKLVTFMYELGIKKYMGISLFISILLSTIKFFEYDINTGIPIVSYPLSYDYMSSDQYRNAPKIVFFILNFISDILNHFVFLLVNLAIDIGMVVKLKQTLNERLEKFKAYSTTAQQEKKKSDNENVLNNAISMVIFNTTLNLLLKLPTALYSMIYLFYGIYRQHINYSVSENRNWNKFYMRVCIDAYLCEMFLKLSEFLYLLSISLQFLFYKHYDKKLNSAFKKIFEFKKKNQS